MRMRTGNRALDIDADRTREYYGKADTVTRGCSCAGCRNYERAADGFPAAVKQFFDRLGADLKKPAEVVAYGSPDGGKTVLYGGFFPLCGTVPDTGEVWKRTGPGSYGMDEKAMYEIADGFRAGFSGNCSLPDGDFPQPAVRMEILFHCPWVLPEENPY